MSDKEQEILKSTKEFAKTHKIKYDDKIEGMILNAMREIVSLPTVGVKEKAREFINSDGIKEELDVSTRMWLEFYVIDLLESFAQSAPQVSANPKTIPYPDNVNTEQEKILYIMDVYGIKEEDSDLLRAVMSNIYPSNTPQISEEELKVKAKAIYIEHWKDWIEKTFGAGRPDTIDFKEDGGSYEHIIKAMIEFLNCASSSAPQQISEEEIEDWLKSEAPYNIEASHIHKWLLSRSPISSAPTIGITEEQEKDLTKLIVAQMEVNAEAGKSIQFYYDGVSEIIVKWLRDKLTARGEEMICANCGVSQEDIDIVNKAVSGQHKGKGENEIHPSRNWG